MNSRERVVKSLNYEEPDRIPIDIGSPVTSFHIESYMELRKYLGFQLNEVKIIDHVMQTVKAEEDILQRFHSDTRHVFIRPAKLIKKISHLVYEDEWGIRTTKPASSHYFDMIEHPLTNANLDDLEKFNWPDPTDTKRIDGLKDETKRLYESCPYALVLNGFSETFFGLPSWLRGHQQFYMDLLLNPKFVNNLLDKLLNYWETLAEIVLELIGEYIQVVRVADDLGTQRGLIISPQLYRKYIKPKQKEFYSFIKERTDAKLLIHSCGSIYEIIPDLIEIGIDVINPVQVSAKNMDSLKLKKEFGGKLGFWGGGCDNQHILPCETPKKVEKEVKKRISDFAPGGGFIFAPIHNIQYDVPPENICKLFNTVLKVGKYPLKNINSIK
jgi:uroporphyrinogen decarboxylase